MTTSRGVCDTCVQVLQGQEQHNNLASPQVAKVVPHAPRQPAIRSACNLPSTKHTIVIATTQTAQEFQSTLDAWRPNQGRGSLVHFDVEGARDALVGLRNLAAIHVHVVAVVPPRVLHHLFFFFFVCATCIYTAVRNQICMFVHRPQLSSLFPSVAVPPFVFLLLLLYKT